MDFKKIERDYFISIWFVRIFFVVFLLIVLMILLPIKVAEVQSPAQTTKNVFVAGEDLHYIIEYCIFHEGSVTITRRIVDSVVYSLPSINTVSKIGCNREVINAGKLPVSLPSGTYVLKMSAVHHVNFFRTEIVDWETNEFEVVNPALNVLYKNQ